MKTTMTAAMAATVFVLAVPASAQPRQHDHKLEKAAADAFAARAGGIRGTFGLNEKPVLLTETRLEQGRPLLGWQYREAQKPVPLETKGPFQSVLRIVY